MPLGERLYDLPWLSGKHAGQTDFSRPFDHVQVWQRAARSGRAGADPMLTFLTASQGGFGLSWASGEPTSSGVTREQLGPTG